MPLRGIQTVVKYFKSLKVLLAFCVETQLCTKSLLAICKFNLGLEFENCILKVLSAFPEQAFLHLCQMRCMLICKAWAVGDATLSANQHSPPRYSNNSSAYQDLAGWKLLLLGCHGNQMWVPPPILAVSFYLSLFLFSGEAAVQL